MKEFVTINNQKLQIENAIKGINLTLVFNLSEVPLSKQELESLLSNKDNIKEILLTNEEGIEESKLTNYAEFSEVTYKNVTEDTVYTIATFTLPKLDKVAIQVAENTEVINTMLLSDLEGGEANV